MNDSDIWYFAYGSNINKHQKTERTGDIRESKRAILRGFKLTFSKRKTNSPDGKADIIETGKENDIVYGVVYRIKPRYLDIMDKSEGVSGGYYKRLPVTVETEDNEKIKAIAYDIVEKFGFCKPSKEYVEKIVEGMRSHGFEEDIIENMKKIAEGK